MAKLPFVHRAHEAHRRVELLEQSLALGTKRERRVPARLGDVLAAPVHEIALLARMPREDAMHLQK